MSCEQTSAVEALQDGRLAAGQAEAMRVHLAGCAECTAELRRLDDLKVALRGLTETDAPAARVLAGRRRLLEAAAGAGERRRLVRGASVALAAAAAIVLFGIGSWRGKTPALPAAAPGFEVSVTPLAGARWSRVSATALETLSLDDGGLGVTVRRHDARHRLLVELPDGELEDVGTVFSVRVAAGRTEEVTVREGVVALRLRGRAEQRLAAGESYHASEPAGVASGSVAPAPSGAAASSDVVTPVEHSAAGGRASRTSTRAGDEPATCPEASLFQDGVQAFRRGDYASAAGTLDRFAAACPHTGHAEDAAYLRMVALARAGRPDEARVQALAYLKRFPNGFRRKEAERLAGTE